MDNSMLKVFYNENYTEYTGKKCCLIYLPSLGIFLNTIDTDFVKVFGKDLDQINELNINRYASSRGFTLLADANINGCHLYDISKKEFLHDRLKNIVSTLSLYYTENGINYNDIIGYMFSLISYLK